MLIAGGVTFYLLLAMFPALAALVSPLYGLAADPMTIANHLRKLAIMLPPEPFDIVADQIRKRSYVDGEESLWNNVFRQASLSRFLWRIRIAARSPF